MPPSSRVAAAALAVHAALLFISLGLLPVWGDEYFTLATVQRPGPEILEILNRDIHPPLYYLAQHWWLKIPFGLDAAAQARALSALFSLCCLALLDVLLLRRMDGRVRIAALALLATSPCLVLYARMARSYSLQMLAALLVVAAARWLSQRPRSTLTFAAAAAALTLALYTHYVPGLALLGGFALWFAARRDWRAAVIPASAALLAYTPWLAQIVSALSRWSTKDGLYRAAGGGPAEIALEVAFWFFSATFGETPGMAGIVLAAVLAPALVIAAWRARGVVPWPWLLVAAAALIGFVGTTRWVSFSFVPARMLWVLPFWLVLIAAGGVRHGRAGMAICCALLASNGLALRNYFARDAFLNKGYVAPFDAIARHIAERSPAGTVAIFDTWSMDAHLMAAGLPPRVRSLYLHGPASLERAVAAARSAPVVWYCRASHDVSPGDMAMRLERQLASGRHSELRGWVPYDDVDRIAMRLLRWRERPQYVYRLVRIAGPQTTP